MAFQTLEEVLAAIENLDYTFTHKYLVGDRVIAQDAEDEHPYTGTIILVSDGTTGTNPGYDVQYDEGQDKDPLPDWGDSGPGYFYTEAEISPLRRASTVKGLLPSD